MIDLSHEGPGHPRLVLALIAALALAPAGCDWNRLPRADIDFPESWRYADRVNPVREPSAMISTVDAYATRVGLSVLEDGGNAVDAAIAISFSLAVVNPEAGNIGGGGFMVIRLAGGEVSTLDYRERAPKAASRDMYLDEQGEVTEASVRGHLAAGVPGSVMGLWEAHRRFGSLDWERLVGLAVELAEGFEVGERLAASLRGARRSLEGFDATRSAFLPGGEPPAEGEIFRQPDLARTLSRVRDSGVDGVLRGGNGGSHRRGDEPWKGTDSPGGSGLVQRSVARSGELSVSRVYAALDASALIRGSHDGAHGPHRRRIRPG